LKGSAFKEMSLRVKICLAFRGIFCLMLLVISFAGF